jgi:putative zinc finger protein
MADISCDECADLLGEWAEGTLAADLHDALEAHMARCDRCGTLARSYCNASTLARRVTDVPMPSGARARLRRLIALALRRKR